MAKITKDMIIKDIINVNMGCIPILLNEGMHCVGCPASQGETLEEACIVHGLDADVLAKKLNDFVVSVIETYLKNIEGSIQVVLSFYLIYIVSAEKKHLQTR